MDEILKVFEINHIDPPWSHVLVLGLNVIAILTVAWCVLQTLEARRAARQAKRIETATLPLVEGARFVSGHAELAEGSKMAIRVTVGQEGKQIERRNNFKHTWTEVHRQTEAAPFYVRLATGERVRVEPPDDILLVDKLDQKEWILPTWRQRRAELTPGERVIVEGKLERGADPEAQNAESAYRTSSSPGWVMKPDKRAGMHASTEGLSRRHELRARAFTRTAILVALLNLIAIAFVMPYSIRAFLGQNVIAHYNGKEHFQTQTSKGHINSAFVVPVSYTVEQNLVFNERIEVDREDFERLPYTTGKIWLRYVPGKTWATALGLGSSVNRSWALISAAIVGLGAYFAIRTYRHRRWYDGPMKEKRRGPLPIPTNERFAPEHAVIPPKPKPPVARDVEPISTDFSNDMERQVLK